VPAWALERAIFSAADLLIFAWDWSVEPIADAVPENGGKHKTKTHFIN
jgi:hypothetical protein